MSTGMGVPTRMGIGFELRREWQWEHNNMGVGTVNALRSQNHFHG